jgi:hypothetical protein
MQAAHLTSSLTLCKAIGRKARLPVHLNVMKQRRHTLRYNQSPRPQRHRTRVLVVAGGWLRSHSSLVGTISLTMLLLATFLDYWLG